VKEKQKLTLSVDKEVVDKAKVLGINISDITEQVLTGYTSAEKPEGDLHEAFQKLFDSILPLLKQFDCSVIVAMEYEDISYETPDGTIIEDSMPHSEIYLMPNGSFRVQPIDGDEDHYLRSIKKIDPNNFLKPNKTLSNLVAELAKSQESRSEKIGEILMAKRIIDAMSETLLKPPTKPNRCQMREDANGQG
jgi:hypothetical protein